MQFRFRCYRTPLIRTGSDAAPETTLVPAADIDWRHVINLQIWCMRDDRTAAQPGSGGLNIRLLRAAGVRYGITVVFADDTWIWTDMAADLDEAIRSIQRLSAERDKPIRRLGDDERLKAAEY